jgi:hypothetical protein
MQHLGSVLHLGDGLGRNKTATVERVKATLQQGIDIFYLFIGGNKFVNALHGIAGAFREVEKVRHKYRRRKA